MKRRKVLMTVALALLFLLGAIAVWVLINVERSERPVGFQLVRATGPGGESLPIAVWYPTSADPRPTTLLGATLLDVAWDGPVAGRQLPLVLISHGNGGGPGSHADLAMALAGAGYVVAAPLHRGDNVQEQDGMARAGFWSGRNAELIAAGDYMTTQWTSRGAIDPRQIGAFGFSAGGFTVLTAAGARPAMAAVARHCSGAGEFVCQVLKAGRSPLLSPQGAAGEAGFRKDPRIKAAVVAAPGLGFTFAAPGALRDVRVPVQLWAGAADDRVPLASNSDVIRAGLAPQPDYHLIAKAGHLSFLTPCRLLRPSALCSDPAGFDRSAFHREMNREVVRFFDAALGGVAR